MLMHYINIDNLIHDVLNDKLFGFVEVDIKVPDELYNKFSEPAPLDVSWIDGSGSSCNNIIIYSLYSAAAFRIRTRMKFHRTGGQP